MASYRFVYLVGLLVVFACERSPEHLFCRGLEEEGKGINPLISPTQQMCFTSADACAEQATAHHKPTPCVEIARAAWHCFSTDDKRPSTDPMNHTTRCYPSAATCEQSRGPLTNEHDGSFTSGACTPATGVYCQESKHELGCTATEADCVLAADLAASVLHLDLGPCRRHSSGA